MMKRCALAFVLFGSVVFGIAAQQTSKKVTDTLALPYYTLENSNRVNYLIANNPLYKYFFCKKNSQRLIKTLTNQGFYQNIPQLGIFTIFGKDCVFTSKGRVFTSLGCRAKTQEIKQKSA